MQASALIVVGVVLAQTVGISGMLTQPPSFQTKWNTTTYFKEGEDISLPCHATGNPQPLIKWGKDRHYPDANLHPRWRVDPLSGSLVVHSPLKDDEGVYHCLATNRYGTALSPFIEVKRAYLGTSVNYPKSIRNRVGDPVQLSCRPPPSVPEAEIIWQKLTQNGSPEAVEMDSHIGMDYAGNLHITNLLESDEGEYVCLAFNSQSRQSWRANPTTLRAVTGSDNPVTSQLIWRSEPTVRGLLGEDVKMKCIFGGNPTPTVSWSRGNKSITPSTKFSMESFGMELVIRNLQYEDAGEYECRGINDITAKPITVSFNVDVFSVSVFEPRENMIVQRGSMAGFVCQGSGKPRPNVQMFINGAPPENFPQGFPQATVRGTIGETSSFALITYSWAGISDSFVGQCIVSNEYGAVLTNVAVMINSTEEVFPKIKSWTASPLYYEVDGRGIQLGCEADGFPPPVYTWTKNDLPLNTSNTERFARMDAEGTILIYPSLPEDEGIYQCFASSPLGTTVSEEIHVIQAFLNKNVKTSTTSIRSKLGNHVMIPCNAPRSVPEAEISWEYANNSSSQRTTDYEGNLHILSLQADDVSSETPYVCKVYNYKVNMAIYAQRAFVIATGERVNSSPAMLEWMSGNQSMFLMGKQARLKCIFSGNPLPIVTWSKHGGDLPSRARVVSSGMELLIDDLRQEDAGQYECSGHNNISQSSALMNLAVEAYPVWEALPWDSHVLAGEQTRIQCGGSGIPTPNARLYINGKPIDEEQLGSRGTVGRIAYQNSIWTSINLQNLTRNDSMVVQCKVWNKHGQLFRNVIVNVQDEIKSSSQMPTAVAYFIAAFLAAAYNMI